MPFPLTYKKQFQVQNQPNTSFKPIGQSTYDIVEFDTGTGVETIVATAPVGEDGITKITVPMAPTAPWFERVVPARPFTGGLFPNSEPPTLRSNITPGSVFLDPVFQLIPDQTLPAANYRNANSNWAFTSFLYDVAGLAPEEDKALVTVTVTSVSGAINPLLNTYALTGAAAGALLYADAAGLPNSTIPSGPLAFFFNVDTAVPFTVDVTNPASIGLSIDAIVDPYSVNAVFGSLAV